MKTKFSQIKITYLKTFVILHFKTLYNISQEKLKFVIIFQSIDLKDNKLKNYNFLKNN